MSERDAQLGRFKRAVFENALRLFEDSVRLYVDARYPSAFQLAASCFEELGKVHVIDRCCDSGCLNPSSFELIYENFLSHGLLTDHMQKQRYAVFDALGVTPTEDDALWRWVNSAGLEQERQASQYVGLRGGRIEEPSRITQPKALKLLRLCADAFAGTAETAFNGFTAEDSAKCEWLARRALADVDEVIQRFEGS